MAKPTDYRAGLDPTDIAMIEILQDDGRISVSELGRKVGLSQPAAWFRETYDPAPDTAEFDRRMAAFYASQGQKADVTWSARSGKRVNGSAAQMTGRENLRPWMEKEGFCRR